MKGASPTTERIVKRYDNRKLYDSQRKSYITLEALARLVADGHDVKVLDQKTGEDLTNTVLAQVILESLKERTATIPRQVLVRLIRLGMSPAPAASSARPKGKDAATRAREEAETIVAGLLRRGGLNLEEALALRQEIAASLHRMVGETQRGLEQRFHGLLEWSERESGKSQALQSLRERLLTLESYFGDRQASGAASKPPASRRPRPRRRPGGKKKSQDRTQ